MNELPANGIGDESIESLWTSLGERELERLRDRQRVYRAVQPEVARIARRALRGQAPPDELIHDICAQVVLSLSRYRGDCAFSTWVHSLVVRHARKWIRDSLSRRRIQGSPGTTDIVDLRPLPDDALDVRRMARSAFVALNQLSIRERLCFVRVAVEGCSTEEVATELGTTQEAVRRSVFRARVRLKRLLRRGGL